MASKEKIATWTVVAAIAAVVSATVAVAEFFSFSGLLSRTGEGSTYQAVDFKKVNPPQWVGGLRPDASAKHNDSTSNVHEPKEVITAQPASPTYNLYTQGGRSFLISGFTNRTGMPQNDKYLALLTYRLKEKLQESGFSIHKGKKDEASHYLTGEIITISEIWEEETVRIVMEVSLGIERRNGQITPRNLKSDLVLYKNQYSMAPEKISGKVMSLLDLSSI